MNSPTPEKLMNVKLYTSMNILDYANANNVASDLIDITITNENGQTTDIVEGNFIAEADVLYAHVLRDSSSAGGLLEGNHIEGSVHELAISLKSTTRETRLNSVVVNTVPSQGHMN